MDFCQLILSDFDRMNLNSVLNVLRLQLRELPSDEPIQKWLPPDEVASLETARNKATQILTIQARRFRELHENKRFEQFRLFELMATVREFFELQGKVERIKNTPLMRHYSFFTTIFVWVFVLFLPFGFVEQMDWKMIPLFVLISTIFTMLDKAGTFTETPFDNNFNDVAMDAICRTIEIDMLQQIGSEEIPDSLVAVDGVLM
jgi:putative membrane protein